MRYILVLLALLGITFASLALREHYRIEASPCSINTKWDCGIVNKSEYAVFLGVPVAMIGIAGYALLAVLAWKRAYPLLLGAAIPALAFSLYLTYVEANILQIWCIYCVASLSTISTITLLSIGTVVASCRKTPTAA